MKSSNCYKVSIVVPIFKVEKYVERCARSLFEQTYDDIQYIFVNDCTPDRSVEIVLRVIDDYPNRKDDIIIINHETNRGSSVARNSGIKASTGEFIMQVDSDDFIDVNSVEELVLKQEDGDFDIVSANLEIIYPNERCVLYKEDQDDRNRMICEYVRSTPTHTLVSRLVRRKIFVDNNISCLEGYNIAEDQQVMPQLCYYASSFGYIDKCLYHYDCSNSYSQMHNELNINTIKQDIKAFEVLYLFFLDKDIQFCDAVISGHKEYVLSKFLYTVRKNNFSFYKEIKKYLELNDLVFQKCNNNLGDKLRFNYIYLMVWHYSIMMKWKLLSLVKRV